MNLRRNIQDQQPDLLIDLAPLIDVVFILLIFFMVSTTFSRESAIEVSLPEASAQQQDEQPKIIDVSVDREGHYYVAGKTLINDRLDTLKRALQREARQFGKDSPAVIINADAQSPHQAVIRVMDAARQAGLVRLSFATQKQAEKSE